MPWGYNRVSLQTATDAQKHVSVILGDYVFVKTSPQTGCESSAALMSKLDKAYSDLFNFYFSNK